MVCLGHIYPCRGVRRQLVGRDCWDSRPGPDDTTECVSCSRHGVFLALSNTVDDESNRLLKVVIKEAAATQEFD